MARTTRRIKQLVEREVIFDVCEYCLDEEEIGSPYDVPERPVPAGWLRLVTESAQDLRLRPEGAMLFCSWGCLEEFVHERCAENAPTTEAVAVL